MISVIALASIGTSPAGELAIYRDWIVGCENIPACHATSLDPDPNSEADVMPDFVADNAIRLTVRRGAAPRDDVIFQLRPNPFEQAADVSRIRVLAVRGDMPTVAIALQRAHVALLAQTGMLTRETVARLAAVIANGKILEFQDLGGTPIASASLIGLKEAMRHMDTAQHREGNETALIDPGNRPAYHVPPYLPAEAVQIPPRSSLAPVRPARRALASLVDAARCRSGNNESATKLARLDAVTTLLLVTSACASYKSETYVYLVSNDGSVKSAILQTDARSAPVEQPIVGAWWDDSGRRLHSFGRGRGLADCGTHRLFAWTGGVFRLVQEAAMGACRGSTDYITVYRWPVQELP